MKIILLAEDGEDDVFFFKRALERRNIKNPLHVVSDGEEMMQYLAGRGKFGDRKAYPWPDLIFLDIKMPKRTGLEVLDWLRNKSGLPYVPVIVLSSSGHKPDLECAYRLGANSYFIKKGSPAELESMLERAAGYWLEMNCIPKSE
jgi:CheY-like chemotaxis protein